MIKIILLFWFSFLFFTPTVFGESIGSVPSIKDQDFVIERYVTGIESSPTTMAFVGNDILVLQKHDGKVTLIRDGHIDKVVLDVSVTNYFEQGMLGITTVASTVYLYFTESTSDGGEPIAKRVYKYEWNGNELVNPILLKDLPQTRPYHNGGAMVTGLDNSVYLILGDAGRYGKLQNHKTGEPDDTSVITRVDKEEPYYAMGIRNSFGLAVDPVTGNLWDTENGDDDFDEINLVMPHFNSGWEVIMGPATQDKLSLLPGYEGYVYSDPEFSWQKPIAPTAITFANSEPLAKFQNSVFVGDCIYGNLYKFDLNSDRTEFVFTNTELQDKVVNIGESLDEIIFGEGFGCITDLEIGPDGLLYIVSLSEGTIFRMIPQSMTTTSTTEEGGGCLIATATYGSELAPQVQFLREIRDNTVLSTASGTSFMTAFNSFYYSFSPAVADLERQNPMFKETVKVTITPLLSSLSLLQHVDIDSEAEMLGYGIGIILLNIGMYFVAPLVIISKLKKKLAKNRT
jgi:glucose/arabinose dehydrogenase